jgi:hypothetical protein
VIVLKLTRAPDPPGIRLRLNSKLFFFDQFGDNFHVSEIYSVKGGAPIVRPVGNWSTDMGLIVETPNIWDRRSNLMGTHLVCITIDFSIITKVQLDATSGNLMGVTGLFQAGMKEDHILLP